MGVLTRGEESHILGKAGATSPGPDVMPWSIWSRVLTSRLAFVEWSRLTSFHLGATGEYNPRVEPVPLPVTAPKLSQGLV